MTLLTKELREDEAMASWLDRVDGRNWVIEALPHCFGRASPRGRMSGEHSSSQCFVDEDLAHTPPQPPDPRMSVLMLGGDPDGGDLPVTQRFQVSRRISVGLSVLISTIRYCPGEQG